MVGVAQLVEHWVVIPDVAGSSPVAHPEQDPGRGFPGPGLSYDGAPRGSRSRTRSNRPRPRSPRDACAVAADGAQLRSRSHNYARGLRNNARDERPGADDEPSTSTPALRDNADMNAPPSYNDVETAARRIAGRVRTVPVAHPGMREPDGADLYFALEHLQHTGTFKPRGAQNFLRAHLEAETLPPAGVTIASGGNAGMACAWAAGQVGVRATVFLPASVPQVK